MDRRGMRDYFHRKSAVGLIVFGVLLAPILIGIFLLIAGILRARKNRRLPSDAQIDAWIEEDLTAVQKHSFDKTGLDEDDLVAEPVIVKGLRFWNIGGAEIGIRAGDDRTIRFSPIGVTVICFTPDQLVAYQCALDLFTGKALSESTEEYFYQDVVSVSTTSDTLSWSEETLSKSGILDTPLKELMVGGKLQFNAAETFVLTTSGGTNLEVVLSDPKLIEVVGGGSIPIDTAEKAIRAVRKMLREKKGGARPQ